LGEEVGGNAVGLLDGAQVVGQPGFVERLVGRQVGDDFGAECRIGHGVTRQPFKEVNDGGNCVVLVLLVRVKLQAEFFH